MDTLAALFLVVVGVALLVAYVALLVNAAKSGRWAWFVVMLIFWPAALAYLFTVTPARSRSAEGLRYGRRGGR